MVSESSERYIRNKLETIARRQQAGQQSREELESRVETLERDCRDLVVVVLALLDTDGVSLSMEDGQDVDGGGISGLDVLDEESAESLRGVVDRLREREAESPSADDSESSPDTYL